MPPPPPPSRTDVPLLYSPGSEPDEAAPLVTPSEEEMERYLRQQLKAAAAPAAASGGGKPSSAAGARSALVSNGLHAVLGQAAGPGAETKQPLDDDPPAVQRGMQTPPRRQAPDGIAAPRGDNPAPREPRAAAAAVVSAPAPVPAMASLKQIGRFGGLKRQGRTDVGTLYRAVDPRTGREAAVHVLHAPAFEGDAMRALLLHQLQAAASLSHPNIAAVGEVAVDQDQLFLVGAVVDGETLPQHLQTHGPLPLRQTVELGLQLARALDHAHRSGILHRDLKPANVLLVNEATSLQLTGFGMAVAPDGPTGAPAPGSLAAARQYMTPEQTRGEAQDARSDIFAAGVILYEMLAGERPFRGSTPLALATRIATEAPSPLQPLRPDMPAALRRVVERCLAKAPHQRYASAKDLADALLRVLGDLESAQMQGNRARRLSLRTVWAVVAGTASLLVAGAAAAGVALWQMNAIRDQAEDQGRNLARFMAAQHAEQVLAEDWGAAAAQLLPALQALGGERLAVVDVNGLVRVSSAQDQVGQPFSPEGAARAPARPDGTEVREAGARLDFEAPILMQGKTLGRMVVGLPAPQLLRATQATGWLLALVVLAAALVAAAVAYALAHGLAKPFAALGEALAAVGKGRFDQRMPAAGSSEFGRLYASVDAMALALQRREDGQDKARAV